MDLASVHLPGQYLMKLAFSWTVMDLVFLLAIFRFNSFSFLRRADNVSRVPIVPYVRSSKPPKNKQLHVMCKGLLSPPPHP